MGSKRKPTGEELKNFLEEWDKSTHLEKITSMVEKYNATYGTMANWANQHKHISPPKYEEPLYGSLEEHFEAFKKIQRLTEYHERPPTEITIKIKTKLPIMIGASADWHLGAAGMDYDSLLRDIKFITTIPGAKFILGGDNRNNIIQPSKMGSSHNQMPINLQNAAFYMIIKELMDHILAIGTGNHNFWTTFASGEDWDSEVAHRLQLVYLKHRAYINLVVGDMSYPILWMHKSRFNSSTNITNGGKQNQRLYYPDARIIITEHTHVADVEQYDYNRRPCVAMVPGSYNIRDDYSEMNGYATPIPRNPCVVLFPYEDKIVPFSSMYTGAEYIQKYYER